MVPVLVYHHDFISESDASSERTEARLSDWKYSNVWQTKIPPYGQLHVGTRILLLDTWPGSRGRISWLVRAAKAHTAETTGKEEAIRLVAGWSGFDENWVREDPYTAEKPARANIVVYWEAEPVIRLDWPRPDELALARNGWLVTDTDELRGWGLPALPDH